jgi:predicted small metal-binding protein
MAKGLKCADVGFDCDAEISAESEDEVMSQAEQHARDAHGMSEQDFQQHEAAVRGAIRDV